MTQKSVNSLLSSLVLFRSVEHAPLFQGMRYRQKVHIPTEVGVGWVGNENVTGFKAILRILVAKLVPGIIWIWATT